jgi:hypothetical protein
VKAHRQRLGFSRAPSQLGQTGCSISASSHCAFLAGLLGIEPGERAPVPKQVGHQPCLEL